MRKVTVVLILDCGEDDVIHQVNIIMSSAFDAGTALDDYEVTDNESAEEL